MLNSDYILGKLDHVSISQCSRLESDLHELWSKLKTISSVPKDVIETMERVLQQLLDLSLIVPSSPDIPAIKVGQGLAEALTSLRQIINGSIKQVNARQKAVRELQRLEALFNVSHREPSPKHTSEVASRPHYHQTEIDA